jgi:hypothetical protein
LAFTFCKDRPLDREAFRDPRAFLQRSLAAPKVTLSSRPIVQRHVNAFLLGSFMRERIGDVLKMQIGAFLGCPADPSEARPPKADRPVEAFIEWLERPATAAAHRERLTTLTRRSILEGDQQLVGDTKDAITELASGFATEWEGLVTLAKDEGLQEAGKSRMAVELKRMCGEFLLGGLADRVSSLDTASRPTWFHSCPARSSNHRKMRLRTVRANFAPLVLSARSISRYATMPRDRKSYSTVSSTNPRV